MLTSSRNVSNCKSNPSARMYRDTCSYSIRRYPLPSNRPSTSLKCAATAFSTSDAVRYPPPSQSSPSTHPDGPMSTGATTYARSILLMNLPISYMIHNGLIAGRFPSASCSRYRTTMCCTKSSTMCISCKIASPVRM